MIDDAWRDAYPDLFAPKLWGPRGETEARFGLADPPEDAIGNVHVICRTGDGIVVCASDEGARFLPGGTREPGESIEETAQRELLEEAGVRLRSPLTWCGAFRCDQSGPRYRPHLPYPINFMLYAVADGEVTGNPTSPPDGEQITEVLVLPPEQAADWLQRQDPIFADLVRLTVARGLI
jgi:8-oxo-dGTP diphosphatase